jgi:hypothetical protein
MRPALAWVRHPALGAAALAAIAVLAAGGALVGDAPAGGPERRLLWLDGERGAPALLSASLLVLAGLAAGLLAMELRDGGRTAWWAWALAILLPLLALDEALEIHERVSDRLGVGWLQLYVPVALVGAVAWASAARAAPSRRLLAALVVAAACWGSALALEHFEWPSEGGRARGYAAMMVVEEIVEMVGALLLWRAFAAWGGARRKA